MLRSFIFTLWIIQSNILYTTASFCNTDNIVHPGLEKDRTKLYLQGEIYRPQCVSGYKLVLVETKLVCEEGKWIGPLPPCVADDCADDPPTISHGRFKPPSKAHSSFAQYECEPSYFMQRPSTVQCVNGKWMGTAPVCKDTRCKFSDLKQPFGVIISQTNFTQSGDHLQLQCLPGYELAGFRPLCVRGIWEGNGHTLCRERNCTIVAIQHGAFYETTERSVWKWKNLRQERRTRFKKVKIGTHKPTGETLHVLCLSNRTISDKEMLRLEVTCKRGLWEPVPKCF